MKSNVEYLKFCQSEVARSKRWRDQDSFDDDWRRWIDLYRGRQYEGGDSATDRLIVNIVFATVNVLLPAVSVNNPKFSVNARNPKSQAQAMLTEEILNYLWRTHKYQADFRLSVLDFITIGHGWLKVGYKWVKEPEEKEAEEIGDTESDAYDEGIDDREAKDGNVESELSVEDDRPFLERISPFDIFVDPDARHPKEARWIAQRTWRPLADVQVDSRYSATARKQVSSKTWSRWASGDSDGDARSGDSQPSQGLAYAEVIEFYDVKRKKVSTFSMSNGDEGKSDGFLIKPKKMPYASGQPFIMLRNFEVPDHFYPIGDIEQIESLQLELNETRNQMMNHRKRYARKWLYEKDAFDRDGIAALESDVDNAMIPVLSDGDPGKVISAVPAVITPPEFYNQSDLISTDMDRVSGVSDYQRGAQTAIKRTATEAAMIQDASNARAQDRLTKIEDALSQVGERIIMLMQQFLTGEHVARVISIPGAAWLEYDKDYIKGQFDFSVQAGSTEPMNETFRRQSSMQLVDASMPFLENGTADPVALYRKVLSGFGITDPTEYINQQVGQPGGDPAGSAPPPQGQQPALPPGPPVGGPQGMPNGMPPSNPMEEMEPGEQMEPGDMMEPGEMPMGPPPGAAPMQPGMLPPELAGLPPEILQAIMSGQIQLPPPAGAMPPGAPEGIPPELLQMLMQQQAQQG